MDFLLIKRERELGNSSCVVLEASEAGPKGNEAEVRKQWRTLNAGRLVRELLQ